MNNNIAIRTGKDRLRYTLTFELLLISLLMVLGAYVTKRNVFELGLLAALLSMKAMVINYLYNYLFDKMDVRAGRIPTQRSVAGRIVHALGFEVGLAATSLPIFMWWLQLSFLQALATNITLVTIAMIYTFLFSWGYDRLFPVPQPCTARTSG